MTDYNMGSMGYPCHLSAADGCAGPHGEDREDPHEEGQDGGQQEAPPLPLPATYNIQYTIYLQ